MILTAKPWRLRTQPHPLPPCAHTSGGGPFGPVGVLGALAFHIGITQSPMLSTIAYGQPVQGWVFGKPLKRCRFLQRLSIQSVSPDIPLWPKRRVLRIRKSHFQHRHNAAPCRVPVVISTCLSGIPIRRPGLSPNGLTLRQRRFQAPRTAG